ncbi:MAG TPA: TetR/AcrR family transcriptional regulator [Gemmatimonadales bacterium]|nr:TetR/AcrR family transcriptional regulator [Gemmatimonadales bacterium]
MNETHEKILDVTLRLYAERGYLGTTTRRIAEEADVNEVTLFRHFGSKDALIRSAIEAAEARSRPLIDHDTPDPDAEVRRWVRLVFAHYYGNRNLICQVMADMVQYPDMAPRVCDDTNQEFHQVDGFVVHLMERGVLPPLDELARKATAGSLFGGIFTHAMWRDYIPDIPPVEPVLDAYVDAFWRSVRAPWSEPARAE